MIACSPAPRPLIVLSEGRWRAEAGEVWTAPF